MKFTPGQVQETLRLSPAAFRHWKNALPPLGGRNGYSPCFSPGDLLAMAIVKSLTEDIGIRVGNLSGLAIPLFEHCSRNSWTALERLALLIRPLSGSVTSVPEAQLPTQDEPTIVLALRPIIAELRARLLLEQQENTQETLRFPPTALVNSGQR
jgi:hypothetical protein